MLVVFLHVGAVELYWGGGESAECDGDIVGWNSVAKDFAT